VPQDSDARSFSEDAADPFLHFSEATEHPGDPRVVVKTWEY